MRLDPPAEPITEDDDAIRAAVLHAEVASLLPAVAQATGDLSLLKPELRPDPERLLEPDAGLGFAQLAEARRLAVDALARWRDAGCPPAPPPSEDTLRQLFEFLVGEANAGPYFPVLREELAIEGDLRAPSWRQDEIAPGVEFSVAIVGAGMSGLAAAHRLQQAGVAFTIYEKNADVGGTWFENTYPGARVDVPNHLYSYSFAQTGDWPQFFSDQKVLLDYFRMVAGELGLRPHIRFDTEVLDATFDEASEAWVVRTRTGGPDGPVEEHRHNALVSAVGQLNRPSFPAIPGRERFAGPSFHSARWEHDVDLSGKRVAVIGTGASAVQFIPPVADQADHVVVFQRTPPWLVPTFNYMDDLPDGLRWVIRHVPSYARWDRLWQFWRMHEGLLPAAVVDPDWPNPDQAVSEANDTIRMLLTMYLQVEFPDPDLFAKVLPTYPPIAKRIVRDNGIWAKTLARENVELTTERIAEIDERGIVMDDGTRHDVDVLIYGTGFQASKFLTPMRVVGRGGVDLHERWDGDARAYLGITVPEFPNLFLLYGPNTNIVINGSIVYFSECEVHYVLEAIRLLLETGHRSLECRPEVHDAYNETIDAGNRSMAWGASSVNSWYKNDKGRVAQNWPFSLLEYWQQTRAVRPEDYVLR